MEGRDRCPRCALPLHGPVAAGLWRIDQELAGLRAREADLLARREHLLGLLRADRDRGARDTLQAVGAPGVPSPLTGPHGPQGPHGPRAVTGPAVPAGAVPRKDFSPRAVQNLLLGLGGLLLTIAAVVFTVVSWGHIGIGGRGAILGGVTVLTLAAPRLLTARGLTTTAETIAMLGVALLFLDGYAAWRVGLAENSGLSGLDYTALLFGVVALIVAGYSRLLPLRLPPAVAIVLAQVPLPLLALDGGLFRITVALVVTAAADAALLLWAERAGSVAVPRVCFGVVWTLGVACGVVDSSPAGADFLPGGPAGAPLGGVPLVAAAVIGAVVAPRLGGYGARVLTAGSVLALATGLGAFLWPSLPPDWWAVPYTAGALAAGAVALFLPGPADARTRSLGAACAGCLAGLIAVPFLPSVIFALLTPLTRLDRVWLWPGDLAGAGEIWPPPCAPVVLGLPALAAAAVARRTPAPVGLLALVAGAPAVAVVPFSSGWGLLPALVLLTTLAVVLVAGLALGERPVWAGTWAAVAVPVAVIATAVALAERTTTYVTLAVLTVAWGAAARAARVPAAGATALVAAVLSATGLIWAVVTGTGWQPVDDGLSLALAAGALSAALTCLHRWPGAGDADPRRRAGVVLSAVLAVLAVPPLGDAFAAIAGLYRPLARPWAATGDLGHHPLLIVVVALVTAAAVTVAGRVAGRGGVIRAGLTGWPLLSAALPISVGMPYGMEVGLLVAGAGPAAWVAARGRANAGVAGVSALVTLSSGLSWALASEPATLAALPVAAVAAALVALGGRVPDVRAAAAGTATLLAGGEALAAGIALEWPVRHAAFGLLAVACAAAAVAGRFRSRPFAAGAEGAGYVLAAVGVALAAASLPTAALACATAGVMMAGTALRPDRRWAGYAGTGLLLVASWLRLLASDITVVEAYTVPFSLVLLAFGRWRARGRALSSWRAYGAGLASSLLPSAVATLTGTGWVRPLSLGVVCLAVLLAGARLRLQAPAFLGGLTLAVVALHELAPWIARVVMAVPRWVPVAAGGLLLVAVGATYEARLRDVRRLREAVTRMR
ncbi:hypothetical protein GCM10017673_41870 [Streptosporangium violaceochromogenes]|nr:hypothetical protein GCM10017673_41870 [Streptosporangium violaceochromogenes]